jgi:hypothetical protein
MVKEFDILYIGGDWVSCLSHILLTVYIPITSFGLLPETEWAVN